MGTELMAAGVSIDACFEEISVARPELVSGIHEAYVSAGARLIETNTFGANAVRLSRHGLEQQVAAFNHASVRLAREAAAGRPVYVAGSVGPLGITLQDAEAAHIDPAQVFTEQLTALLEAGIDAVFFETFIDFEEIRLALNRLRTLDHAIPAICSLVCSEEGRLPSSLPVVQAFRDLTRAGASVVGVNCVTGPHAMTRILQRIPGDFIISAFPNAGYPRYQDGRFLYNPAPEYFGNAAKEFVAHGARLIGGCCGVGPAHIREMVRAVAGLKPIRSKPVISNLRTPEDARQKRPA